MARSKPTHERLMDATDEVQELRRLLEACVRGWYGTAKGAGPVFAEARKMVATWNPSILPVAKPEKPKPTAESAVTVEGAAASAA